MYPSKENKRYIPGQVRPGNDNPETMSVSAYSAKAKVVQDEVTRVLESGWAAAVEKKARGAQIQELLTMASVVRYQVKAIEHGEMTDPLKERIKPPDLDPRLLGSTSPATLYVKTTLIECKERIVALHNENMSLRRALKTISSQVKQVPEDSEVEEIKASTFWDDPTQMGKILEELDLEESEVF